MNIELNEKIQSLSSSQKHKVIAKTKLLYERDNGGYVLWDSYDTRLKAFGVQQKDVYALITAFVDVVKKERRLLLETCPFGKREIHDITKMKTDDEHDTNVNFAVEVKKYNSSQGSKYCKVNFYNLDGVEKKHGVSVFFNDALIYLKYLNLWEKCFDDQALQISTVSVPANDNFF